MSKSQHALRLLSSSWDTLAAGLMILVFLLASFEVGRVAGWIPRIVLGTTLLLIVVRLATEWRAGYRQRPAPPAAASAPVESVSASGLSGAVLWALPLLLAILLLGIAPGSALYCFAYLRLRASASWTYSVVFASVLGIGLHLVFGTMLKANVYRGILFGFG